MVNHPEQSGEAVDEGLNATHG